MAGEGNARRGSTNAYLAEGFFDDDRTDDGNPNTNQDVETLDIDVNQTQ